MGQIQVNTPDGLQTINIAGDEPTEEEKNAIIQLLSSPDVDEVGGVSETVAQPVAQPVDSASEIDYKSGVKNNRLRFFFSRGDNPREKRKQLLKLGIPDEGIIQDEQGAFILDLEKIPENVKTQYGLKSQEGRTKLAIDEEGFSWQDMIDFTGEAGTPVLTGTAAALTTTGVGIPLAVGLVGLASAGGYILDELVEYKRGVRDQTLGEDAKNTAFEFLLGGSGELGGRLFARMLGRFFKGPGNKEAEATRSVARELLKGDVDPETGRVAVGRPTLRATNMAPLLGRAQAFFEGVFPNARVATKNAEAMQVSYLNFLKQSGIPDGQATKTSEEFLEALKNDIKVMYSSPEQMVKNANQVLKDTVEKEINSLIKQFGDPNFAGGEPARKSVEVAKRAFDQQSSGLYNEATSILKGADIIPTEDFVSTFKNLTKTPVTGEEIANSLLGKAILKMDTHVDINTMQGIRTVLREAAYDSSIIGSADQNILKSLLKKADEAMDQAEVSLLEQNSRLNLGNTQGGFTDPATGKFIPRETGKTRAAELALQKSAFESLRAANTFYKEGVSKFQTLYAKKLIEGARKGTELTDPDAVLDFVVTPNRPELLKELLTAASPPGTKINVKVPESYLDLVPDIKIKDSTGSVFNFRQAVRNNPNDDLANFYKQRFAEQKAFSDEVIAAQKTAGPWGSAYSESLRDNLAARFLERTLASPDAVNIFGRLDPLKIVSKIRELGTTAPVLFGRNYNNIMKSLSDVSLLGEEIGERELRMLAGRPITEQIEAINQLTKQVDELKGIPFLRSLENAAASGEVDKVVSLVTRNKDTIRQAEQFLGKNSELMNNIRDQVLAKAIGSLGDPSSQVVKTGLFGKPQRTVSPEFVKNVMSGKQHDQIMKVLNSMGRDKMEMLFGKNFIQQMEKLAQKSEALSMRPIAGLGGLETASLARKLTMGAVFVAPVQILGTMLGLRTMGALLRNPTYLRMVARPTGDPKLAQNLEKLLTFTWGVGARATPRMAEERLDEGVIEQDRNIRNYLNRQQSPSRLTTQPRGGVSQNQVSPILQPPTTFKKPVVRPTASAVEREKVMRQLMGISP